MESRYPGPASVGEKFLHRVSRRYVQTRTWAYDSVQLIDLLCLTVTQQRSGLLIEIDGRALVRLQNGGRMHGVHFQLQAVSDGVCLPSFGHNTNYVSRLENLLNRHRDCPLRYFIKNAKPSLADLLIPATVIEFDDQVRFLCLKVRGRIVECEMSVLTNADECCINPQERYCFPKAPAFSFGSGVITVNEVESSRVYSINDSLTQVFPETGWMHLWQTNVLVKMEKGRPFPVNRRLHHKLVEEFKLRRAPRRN